MAGMRLMARRTARSSVDYGAGIEWDGSVGLGNAGENGVGDCVPAAALQLARVRQKVCFGSDWVPTTALALQQYTAWAGYDGTPATDLGTDPNHAMSLWEQNGIQLSDQLLDIGRVVNIDPTNLDAIRAAIDFGTGVLVSLALKDSDFDTSTPWLVSNAPSVGGHEVCCVKYDAGAFYLITWDFVAEVPNAAFAQRVTGVKVPLSRPMLGAGGVTPDGQSWEALLEQVGAA